ncbi:MAG: hypothetical protein ACOVJ5_00590, partial [Gloeomargaritales cyanobacterium]
MKHIKDYLLIILSAFFAIWVYREFNKTDNPADFSDMSKYTKVKEIRDTLYKNTYRNRYIKGDSIPFVIVAIDTTTIHDTVHILSDYMRIYAYSDTINQDSNIFVINDTISQNRIKSRSFEAK